MRAGAVWSDERTGMKQYTVNIDGIEHTLQMSDEDAKRYPDAKVLSSAKVEDKAVKKSQSK